MSRHLPDLRYYSLPSPRRDRRPGLIDARLDYDPVRGSSQAYVPLSHDFLYYYRGDTAQTKDIQSDDIYLYPDDGDHGYSIDTIWPGGDGTYRRPEWFSSGFSANNAAHFRLTSATTYSGGWLYDVTWMISGVDDTIQFSNTLPYYGWYVFDVVSWNPVFGTNWPLNLCYPASLWVMGSEKWDDFSELTGITEVYPGETATEAKPRIPVDLYIQSLSTPYFVWWELNQPGPRWERVAMNGRFGEWKFNTFGYTLDPQISLGWVFQQSAGVARIAEFGGVQGKLKPQNRFEIFQFLKTKYNLTLAEVWG